MLCDRYKVVELAFYLTMGFFPALVVTSMVPVLSIDVYLLPSGGRTEYSSLGFQSVLITDQ